MTEKEIREKAIQILSNTVSRDYPDKYTAKIKKQYQKEYQFFIKQFEKIKASDLKVIPFEGKLQKKSCTYDIAIKFRPILKDGYGSIRMVDPLTYQCEYVQASTKIKLQRDIIDAHFRLTNQNQEFFDSSDYSDGFDGLTKKLETAPLEEIKKRLKGTLYNNPVEWCGGELSDVKICVLGEIPVNTYAVCVPVTGQSGCKGLCLIGYWLEGSDELDRDSLAHDGILHQFYRENGDFLYLTKKLFKGRYF